MNNAEYLIKCANCRHFQQAKELKNKEWHWFNICTALMSGEYGFALVVQPDDMCECFEKLVYTKDVMTHTKGEEDDKD